MSDMSLHYLLGLVTPNTKEYNGMSFLYAVKTIYIKCPSYFCWKNKKNKYKGANICGSLLLFCTSSSWKGVNSKRKEFLFRSDPLSQEEQKSLKRVPSKHTSQQHRYNVAATSWHCSDVVTMLWWRWVFAGLPWKCICFPYCKWIKLKESIYQRNC